MIQTQNKLIEFESFFLNALRRLSSHQHCLTHTYTHTDKLTNKTSNPDKSKQFQIAVFAVFSSVNYRLVEP